MPLTGTQYSVIREDHERGGTWVRSATAMTLADTNRFEDLAKRFPDHYEVSPDGMGGIELRERIQLIGSPSSRSK